MALSAAGVPEPWRVALGTSLSGCHLLILSMIGWREAVSIPSARACATHSAGIGCSSLHRVCGTAVHRGAPRHRLVTLQPQPRAADVAVFGGFTDRWAAAHPRCARRDSHRDCHRRHRRALSGREDPLRRGCSASRTSRRRRHSASYLPQPWIRECCVCSGFLFMKVFDTIGSVLASRNSGMIRDGKLPRAERVLVVEAAGHGPGRRSSGDARGRHVIEKRRRSLEGGRNGLTAAVVARRVFVRGVALQPLIGMIGRRTIPITAGADHRRRR